MKKKRVFFMKTLSAGWAGGLSNYSYLSTDEQMRNGYSLPEQEDRLLKYCEQNQIIVKGIFREDSLYKFLSCK